MSASISTPQLSSALVAYLRREGKTLREIGEMVGLSESFVSRVANGERSFTIEHLALFEAALGEPLPALVMQAMWTHDLRPEQQADFDTALELLRDLGGFRRSLQASDRAERPGASSAKPARRKPKRAAG
ncbi:MAG TPA: helix-turn-helix transcriptional regulator [Phycisphaerae bacterium]|nr:helix-turn-helix transcriptional regulator [Phycisphaerae bacterium]